MCGGRSLGLAFRTAGELGPEGLIPTTDQFGTALSDIVRCRDCGHMQLERLPAQASLAEGYEEAASEAYLGEESGQRATAAELLARLEAHVRTGRLLDVGCWTGFLLDEARRRGWHTTGVEPSEFASGYARDRLGLDVRTGDLFGVELPAGSFDTAVLADVIEHLPDPGGALDRVSELLAPGGSVLLVLPDAGSRLARMLGARWWSVIPTHVQYFTRASLLRLLRDRGWQPLAVATAPKAFTVRYYLERIAGYSPAASRTAVAVAERAGVAGRVWRPDFRDRMAIIARK